MAIFVYRIGSLGDSIVSVPALKCIKKTHPGKVIILITNMPKNHGTVDAWNVLKYTGVFDDVIYYGNFKSVFSLARRIRSKTGEKALYYLPPVRSRFQVLRDYLFFKFFCGIGEVIGFEKAAKKKKARESDRLLWLAGFETEDLQEELLKVPDPAKQKMDAFLSDDGSIKIAISSGAGKIFKKWPVDKYKKLCRKIIEIENTKIYFVGGEMDKREGEDILEEIPKDRFVNLAGKANVIETAYLLKKCALFIGNDSGNLHLAAAMNIPAIGIYSTRYNPGKWDPVGNKSVIIRKKSLELISVDEVFEKVVEILGESC